MSRWKIRSVHLYSHDGRRRDLGFNVAGVNVVLGASHTGKSVLVELVDYCLGSSRCSLVEYVRSTCSWVAVHWECDGDAFTVGRRVPPPNQQSTEESFYRVGHGVPEVADEIESNANRAGLLAVLEQKFGIGDVKGERFDRRFEGSRVSARHVTPYLFQSDDVINNRTVLLRGLAGDKRQSIVQSAPYFLGVVDERFMELQARLRALKRERRGLRYALDEAEAVAGRQNQRADSILAEAFELGMMEVIPEDPQVQREALELVSTWTGADVAGAELNPQLDELYAEEQGLVAELGVALRRQRAAREFIDAASGFDSALRNQRQRLEPIGLLTGEEVHNCPVCTAPLAERVPEAEAVRNTLDRIHGELDGVGRDKPKLQKHLAALEERAGELRQLLGGVRGRIKALVRERETLEREIALTSRRFRVAGRASLLMEALDALPDTSAGARRLSALDDEIAELDSLVGVQARIDAAAETRDRLTTIATGYLSKLPLEARYAGAGLSLNLRNLEVSLVTPRRSIRMEDVGSDENYMSMHLAMVLALHRVFDERDRPVPGVLFLDQLSRPYFPEDYAEIGELTQGGERQKLRRYLELLFEVEDDEVMDLQVILLEHATFQGFDRYDAAVEYRWPEGDGLVPSDWPELDEDN